jgi:Zn-dependent peptidase ImmA (M78 family)
MMNMMRTTKSNFNRHALATEAMRTAIATRSKGGLNQTSPTCVYELCEKLGVIVRFNSINMEGMYQRGTPPRIHLSARRPLVRRAYNCAHELGHHVFGHGSSIDELRDDARDHPWEDPKEFLADTFAGFVLMPTLGLRRAFAVRRWTPETATEEQIFFIACDFGVGYTTLLTHLTYSAQMISRARAAALQRANLKTIRANILGVFSRESLVAIDRQSAASTVDVEVNAQVLLPFGTVTVGEGLTFERDLRVGRLYRAVRPGIVRASADGGAWAAFVRISRREYAGLAQYRHLEDDEDEQVENLDSPNSADD